MNLRTEHFPDAVIDAVISASRVLVAVAARSLSDIADEVTLPQYRTLVVPTESRRTRRSDWRDTGHGDAHV
jgi:hypothetical protein